MKYFKPTIFILTLFVTIIGYSQTNPIENNKRLTIGDTIPDYTLMNLVNYPMPSAKISDFKGKLLLLDYWFTSCKPCITSWPKLINLQSKFQDNIQIVLVNHMQNAITVKEFIEKRNLESGLVLNMPSVTNDTVLHKVLPPSGYPSIIWIDQNGVFQAVTRTEELNEKNIKAFLNNDKNNVENIIQNINTFNVRDPLYMNKNGSDINQMLWYSTVSRYSKNVKTGAFSFVADSTGYYITITHQSILELIRQAYSDKSAVKNSPLSFSPLSSSRYNLVTNNPTRFSSHISGRRIIENLYTYQLISREPKTINQLQKIMQDDIKKYFDVDIAWEKQKKKCLVLKAADSTLISDFKKNSQPTFEIRENMLVLNNVPPPMFTNYLSNYIHEYYYSDFPILDETNFKGGLDIEFNRSLISNYELFNKLLNKKYNMSFTLEDREIDILIIRDSKDYKQINRLLTDEEKQAIKRESDKFIVIKEKKEKNWIAYQKNFINFVNTYLFDNADELNNHAWEFYQNPAITNKESLNEAIKWIKRSMELNDNYHNNDTYAALLFKLGRKTEALAAAHKALELAKKQGIDSSNTLSLINKIKRRSN